MSKKRSFVDISWRPDHAFNDLPLLPPKADLETKVVLKVCIEARAAIAELRQAALLIPNQSILINTIPILEAKDSSQIENIVTTADRLFEHASNEAGVMDAATKEALRYRTALYNGYLALQRRPLTTATAIEICSLIKGREMGIRKLPGTALAGDKTGSVIYTPPEGESVIRDLLANWEQFINLNLDLDPLIRMCVGHYQFEAIHPFADGNGRTGRVINSLYLIQTGLLTLPILYLSRYIIATKDDYYRLLLNVTRKNAWEDWVIYMLRGVCETARWTVAKIAALHELQVHTGQYVRKALPKIYSRELIDAIFEQPYCRIGNLMDRGIAKRETASRYLAAMCNSGVLAQQVRGRDKLFLHPKLLALLASETHEFVPYET
jgi:Fic family protein